MEKRLAATLAILGLFLLASSPAFALQDSPLSLGPKLGLNYSRLTGDETDELGSKLGFSGGAFLAFALGDWFTLQPEILYSQKGAEASRDTLSGQETYTVSLEYLEIPLLAVLTIPTQSILTPKLFAGPAFAFVVGAKEKLERDGEQREHDIKDAVEDFDAGIVFGGGLDIAVGPGAITTDLRYNWGLIDIVEGESVKNGVFSFMVGYAF